MDKRKSEILIKLVEHANKEQRIAELAELHGVTEKTIRNDIKEINRFLESHSHDQIQLLGNGNVCFSGSQKEITALLENNNFYSYKLEKAERKLVISLLLVQAKGYVTIASLADRLYVSRATLLNDLKDVKVYIREHHLKVTSHPNKGLLVEGSERDKRKLAFEIYSTCYQGKGRQKTNFNPFESFVLKLIENDEIIKIIEKIIIEVESLHHISLTDESFDKLLIYLLITVKRIQKGFYVSNIRIVGENWLEISKNIFERISQYCDVEITEEEEKLLSNIFNGLNYLKKSSEDTEIVKLQIITRKFIEEVSQALQIDLNGDYMFFENLVNHLESFANRGNTSFQIEDVFDDKSIPHEVYQAVNNNIHIIQKALEKQINESELYYIVVHVCAAIERKKYRASKVNAMVVCGGGVGTSQLIAARLNNHFNFKFVDIVARHDLFHALNKSNQKVDLIISTVPLEDVPVDYVVISPNLTGNDILRIYEKVERIKKENIHIDLNEHGKKDPHQLMEQIIQVTDKYVKDYSSQLLDELMSVVYGFFKEESQQPYLYQLLQPDYIQLDVECGTYEEAIRKSAQKLLKEGAIEERYIHAMIQSVKNYGPYIVISEGFAVPHAATDDGSNRVGMNLIRLKDPVDFLGKAVQYVCCLSVVDAKKHLNAFFHLVNLLQNPEFRMQLDKATTPNKIAMVIKDFEQKFV
ncbi:BglG family transcription antiterminator [Caldifermentibacillus hisashii]|uniref:BglG family transcription antiterminator n=1 Tax=Caldifermentibacillus hisashii TaxID=996558 RepID=UPI0034D6AF10